MQKVIDIIYLAVAKLVLYEYNARQHTQKQIRQLANWIKQVGFINPIIVDRNNIVVAGHARLRAALLLDLKTVPCIRVDDLSDDEVRAYRLADNKLAEIATWDDPLLRCELEVLSKMDLEFDIECTGFELPEIEGILHIEENSNSSEENVIPTVPNQPISQIGDIYRLGDHKVACGDMRDAELTRRVMSQLSASVVVTDPPYNVSITDHARSNGKHQHTDFLMAVGEMTDEEYVQFLLVVFTLLKRFSRRGALFYIFIDWRHLPDLFQATHDLFAEMINLCVWNKSNGGMGSFYRSKHELIGVFKHGKAPHINNVQLGKYGRDRTNVWDYPGLSSFSKDRDAELARHPTPKPIALIKDILLDASHRGNVVLDGFLGAGSTLMACEQVHRCCVGIELDPKYVDVTLKRWMDYTGEEPIHIDSGLTFTELAQKRSPAKGV